MLSINEAKKILNKNKRKGKYSDEEVRKIVEVLDNLATIDFAKFTNKKERNG